MQHRNPRDLSIFRVEFAICTAVPYTFTSSQTLDGIPIQKCRYPGESLLSMACECLEESNIAGQEWCWTELCVGGDKKGRTTRRYMIHIGRCPVRTCSARLIPSTRVGGLHPTRTTKQEIFFLYRRVNFRVRRERRGCVQSGGSHASICVPCSPKAESVDARALQNSTSFKW